MSLLSEGIRMNEPYSMRDGGGNGSVAAFCPLRRMEAFQRSLLKAPLSHRHPNLLAPPAPSSFLTANDLRPAPWALPSHDLKKHLEVTGLGSLEVVAVDLAGHCVVSNWVDRDGGTALPLFRPLLNFTTYIVGDWRTESQAAMAPSQCGRYGTPTPWYLSQLWWYAQGRHRPCQPPAPSPISCLLDSVMTSGSGGGETENAVDATQVYYHFKLNHAQVTVI
ncbi:unnamed protein product [Schistocephalus solidus]|uniref:Uncharacterized protein n=1 Tax=Schistocephalus solidus TaxID=70667 RepID=A0A3P7DF48_SCHSO|nr:unnamed protein product [Schistocephalus solidus]